MVVAYFIFHPKNKITRLFVTNQCTQIFKNKTYSFDEENGDLIFESGGKMKLTLADEKLVLQTGKFYDTWVLKPFEKVKVVDGEQHFHRYEKINTVLTEKKFVSCAGFNYRDADKYLAYTFNMDNSYTEYLLYHDLVRDRYCMDFSSDEGQSFKYFDGGTGQDEARFYTDLGTFRNEIRFKVRYKNNDDYMYVIGI